MKKVVFGTVGAVFVLIGLAVMIWYQFIHRDPALWKVDLYQAYNGWDLICDQYKGTDERRCYLRYVDTYSQDPFGAAVFFVQHSEKSGTRLSIDLEKDNHVTSAAFVTDGQLKPTKVFASCSENSCVLESEQTSQFVIMASKAESWHLEIEEADGKERLLAIDLSRFALAELNFVTELKKRGLY